MAPKLEESIFDVRDEFDKSILKTQPKPRYRLSKIVLFTSLHVYFLYIVAFKLQYIQFWTYVFALGLFVVGGLGLTAGAHRLWTHRSYTAKWPLRLFLVYCYSITCHMSLYTWVVNHRQHHKYSDTDLDPHNSRRGFFFSHVGWLIMHKNPECKREEKKIDMSDFLNDPIANFHARYFLAISYIQLLLPSLVPVYVWGEDLHISFMATGILRSVFLMHVTSSVNSFNHIFGTKPYDKRICPTELPWLSFFTLGESWHNYHHTFPWDYKAGEFGDRINLTTRFLDMCGKIGLASDFKTAHPDIIAKIKLSNN